MSESITLVAFIYGLAIVISMAAALLIKLLVGALAFSESHGATAAPPPVKAPPVPSAAVGAIPAHHLVAIAAAAHAMVGAHRIVHIGTGGPGRLWSTEGRLAQHNAHHPH